MLWKKGWWETRWLFLIGLGSIFLAYGLTFGGSYDAASWTERLQRSAALSEIERQALNNYQAQTWALWFKMLLNFIWPYYSVFMGTACLMSACQRTPYQGAARLFTMSLPVSRRKVLLSQAAVGFSEMVAAALLPSLLLPIMARFHGQWFSWSDTMIYLMLTIFGGAVFFFFAFLLTVIIGHRLVVIGMVLAIVIALFLPFHSLETRAGCDIIGVMAVESYFYHGQIPWLGLLISLFLSAVFMFTAVRIYEWRDL